MPAVVVDVVLAADLAVGRDVDSELDLLAHHVDRGAIQDRLEPRAVLTQRLGVARGRLRRVGAAVHVEPVPDRDLRGLGIGADRGGEHHALQAVQAKTQRTLWGSGPFGLRGWVPSCAPDDKTRWRSGSLGRGDTRVGSCARRQGLLALGLARPRRHSGWVLRAATRPAGARARSAVAGLGFVRICSEARVRSETVRQGSGARSVDRTAKSSRRRTCADMAPCSPVMCMGRADMSAAGGIQCSRLQRLIQFGRLQSKDRSPPASGRSARAADPILERR